MTPRLRISQRILPGVSIGVSIPLTSRTPNRLMDFVDGVAKVVLGLAVGLFIGWVLA